MVELMTARLADLVKRNVMRLCRSADRHSGRWRREFSRPTSGRPQLKVHIDQRRGLRAEMFCWGVFRILFSILCSRRCNDTNRRAFWSRRYGQTHTVTERRVHVEVTWFSVRCAFDFSYATELVIVTQLFVLASARYDQKSLTIKVLVQRSKAFCYAAHIFPSGCFRGARAARCCPQHIEDHNVADARTSAPGASQLRLPNCFHRKETTKGNNSPGSPNKVPASLPGGRASFDMTVPRSR